MLNVYLHRSSSFIYYEIQCVAREKCDAANVLRCIPPDIHRNSSSAVLLPKLIIEQIKCFISGACTLIRAFLRL